MTKDEIVTIATIIITVASIFANVLPNDSDNKYLSFLIKIIRLLAFNINVKGVIK